MILTSKLCFLFCKKKAIELQQKKGCRKLTLTWPEFSSVLVVDSVVLLVSDTSSVDLNTLNHKMPSRANPSCKVTVGAGAVASKVFTIGKH